MTREEVIDAYIRQVPVIIESDEGISFRYRRIHGYEVSRGENGEEKFKIILFDEEPRKRITIAAPERVKVCPLNRDEGRM